MQDTIDFFDAHAERWDSYQKPEDIPIIRDILARCGLGKADRVLDVACGTGVLVPYLLELGITRENITAVDISPKMVACFRRKFPGIEIVNCAFGELDIMRSFSAVVVFNSFPHFSEPERVFRIAANFLGKGGKLLIAHTMTREQLDEFHRNTDPAVNGHCLMPNREFQRCYQKYSFRDVVVDNRNYFYALGKKYE